jgi:hypothetical protein
MVFTVPDPSGVANNIDQMYFRRKEWARQQKSDEAQRDTELFAEIQLLVDALNAYAEGYRQLYGELQDFRANWTPQQRQNAEKHYRAWIDPREISVKIDNQLTLLNERRRKDEALKKILKDSLDAIISAGNTYKNITVRPLLERKESDENRAQLIDALATGRTSKNAQIVEDWVGYTRDALNDGKEYLDSVNNRTTLLKAGLSVPDTVTETPTVKTPWYRKILFLRRRTSKGTSR